MFSTVDTATMLLVTSTLVHMANSFLIFPFVTNKMMGRTHKLHICSVGEPEHLAGAGFKIRRWLWLQLR